MLCISFCLNTVVRIVENIASDCTVPMEKHVDENETEEVISLNTVLDVIHDTHQQKCKCTFEHICATIQHKHEDISTSAVAALLEQAVKEKVVKRRVVNNIPLYQMLGCFKHGRRKLATDKLSSSFLSQLSDAVISTLTAAGCTDSKRSLSLKCIEEKITSERKNHIPIDIDLSQNLIIVCKQLVTQGVLQQQQTQYHLVLSTGRSKLTADCRDSGKAMELRAGITRGQKKNRFRYSTIVNAEEEAVGSSLDNESELVSSNYRVIGEVYASEVAGKPCNINDDAKGAGLKRNLGQLPKSLFCGKNLRHRKCPSQSSGEQTLDDAVKPFNRKKLLLKSYKHCSNLGSKQSGMKGHRPVHLADSKVKTLVAAEDASETSKFSTEKLNQSSESLCQNISEVQPDKSYNDGKNDDGKRYTRRSIRNRSLSHRYIAAVATSVTDSLSCMGQPHVSLCRFQPQPVNNNSRCTSVANDSKPSTENNGKENSGFNGGSLESTRNVLPDQPASASKLYGNTFNEVKKT